METKVHPITKISLLIFFGYILLGVLTYALEAYFDWARVLFSNTQIIILVNAVWFSATIVIYGIYSLSKNYKRVRLQKLRESLDSQFMIVTAFLFFSIKQVIDLIIYLKVSNSDILTALADTGKVFEFGGFMAGLASIYLARKR